MSYTTKQVNQPNTSQAFAITALDALLSEINK